MKKPSMPTRPTMGYEKSARDMRADAMEQKAKAPAKKKKKGK